MSLDAALDQILDRYEQIQSAMAGTDVSRDDYVRLSKEFSELGSVVEAIKSLKEVQQEVSDLEGLLADDATDTEMRAMASDEAC